MRKPRSFFIGLCSMIAVLATPSAAGACVYGAATLQPPPEDALDRGSVWSQHIALGTSSERAFDSNRFTKAERRTH